MGDIGGVANDGLLWLLILLLHFDVSDVPPSLK